MAMGETIHQGYLMKSPPEWKVQKLPGIFKPVSPFFLVKLYQTFQNFTNCFLTVSDFNDLCFTFVAVVHYIFH